MRPLFTKKIKIYIYRKKNHVFLLLQPFMLHTGKSIVLFQFRTDQKFAFQVYNIYPTLFKQMETQHGHNITSITFKSMKRIIKTFKIEIFVSFIELFYLFC